MSATKEYPVLETEPRTKLGTRYSKRVREAGRIPAVIYGHKQDPVHVSLHGKTFQELIHHEVHIIDVKLDGKSEHTLLKSVQWDTFGIEVLHVDLERVDLSETVEIEIEVQLVGEPTALKESGTVLEQPLQSVEVSCRADSIPSHLEHNVKDLKVDEQVTVADLILPEGVKVLTDPELLVCQITSVKVDEDVADAIAAGAEDSAETEPEVIGKGKEDEEEGDDED
jgi:large subunit ribosomal protein L25